MSHLKVTLYTYLYEEVINVFVFMSGCTPSPICLTFWLGYSVEPQEYSWLGIKVLS